MKLAPLCALCRKPMPDTAYACARCGDQLRQELALAATIAGEALITVSRLERIGQGGRRTDPYASLPVNLAAAVDHDDAVRTLRGWAWFVANNSTTPMPTVRRAWCEHETCEQRRRGRLVGPRCQGQPPEHPGTVLAEFLAGQVDWFRHRPEAASAINGISDACRILVRVVDRRPDRWYAGPCGAVTMTGPCPEELYPPAGARIILCRCGAVHDAAVRRAWLLAEADDQLAQGPWIAATLTALGEPVKADAIRKWAERRQLLAHAHDNNGRPLYRLGEVRELVTDAAGRAIDRERRAIIRMQQRADEAQGEAS